MVRYMADFLAGNRVRNRGAANLAAFTSASAGSLLQFAALAIRIPKSHAPSGIGISYCQNEGR